MRVLADILFGVIFGMGVGALIVITLHAFGVNL